MGYRYLDIILNIVYNRQGKTHIELEEDDGITKEKGNGIC